MAAKKEGTSVHNGCPSPVGGLALSELFKFTNT